MTKGAFSISFLHSSMCFFRHISRTTFSCFFCMPSLLPALSIHFCLLCTLSPFCDYSCSTATEISALNLIVVALTASHSMLRVPQTLMGSLDCSPRSGAHHDIRPDRQILPFFLASRSGPSPTTVQARLEKSRQEQSLLRGTVARPTSPNFSPSVKQ